MKDSIPPDFNMVVAPTPSLAGDKIPFEGIFAGAGEPFIVPAQGKNVQGGKEWLRLLFSKEGGRFFAESTKSLSAVIGSGEGLDLGTAFASAQEAIAAAGENTFSTRYQGWYTEFGDEVQEPDGRAAADADLDRGVPGRRPRGGRLSSRTTRRSRSTREA